MLLNITILPLPSLEACRSTSRKECLMGPGLIVGILPHCGIDEDFLCPPLPDLLDIARYRCFLLLI